jgi:hypothetical protein
MWYKLDFDKLIVLILPTFLRKKVFFGYIKTLVSPIESLHGDWSEIRVRNIKKLSYNCQKCYLRGALNDRFDSDLERITIEKTAAVTQGYLYITDEKKPVYLGVMYLEQGFNYVDGAVNFLVNVPESFDDFKLVEITALIDFYNLAGKSFKLIKQYE